MLSRLWYPRLSDRTSGAIGKRCAKRLPAAGRRFEPAMLARDALLSNFLCNTGVRTWGAKTARVPDARKACPPSIMGGDKAARRPGAAIDGRALVAVVPAILHPLINTVVHIEQTKGVGRKPSYRNRSILSVAAFTTGAPTITRLTAIDLIAPTVAHARSRQGPALLPCAAPARFSARDRVQTLVPIPYHRRPFDREHAHP